MPLLAHAFVGALSCWPMPLSAHALVGPCPCRRSCFKWHSIAVCPSDHDVTACYAMRDAKSITIGSVKFSDSTVRMKHATKIDARALAFAGNQAFSREAATMDEKTLEDAADFVAALDSLVASAVCADLKMSGYDSNREPPSAAREPLSISCEPSSISRELSSERILPLVVHGEPQVAEGGRWPRK